MRIIAGQFKGHKLLPPRGLTTRPITSRVKTALFSILAQSVEDAVVADLFAGTGTIGLEALSRGARKCYFAERDPVSLARLRRNIEALGLDDRCRIWRGDIMRGLRHRLEEVDEGVDLAFVDPPYRQSAGWCWAAAAKSLFDPLARRLGAGGLVILRCNRNIEVPQTLGSLCVRDRRDYGKMSLVFLSPPKNERPGAAADDGEQTPDP